MAPSGWYCVTPCSHLVPGQGMELPPLLAMLEPWEVPCQPSCGQEITPGTSHFSRKSENASNVRTQPNDSEELCYGNAELCPLGLVAPGISLGRGGWPHSTFVLTGISLADTGN